MKRSILVFLFPCIFITFICCNKRISQSKDQIRPVPLALAIPQGFPYMNLAAENPTTARGVQLGRMLFFDPIIDSGNVRSCGGCHMPGHSFSSPEKNSLPHVNLVWNYTFLWNGKVDGSLENIMLFEVEHFFKADMSRLNKDKKYHRLFRQAFGVDKITPKEVAFALAQFERTMTSSNSKYDRFLRGEATLNREEEIGRRIYFSEKGDCFHCHGTVLLTDNSFHNNGLDSLPGDKGRDAISGMRNDHGKFKTPTLRNIALTAPYMHDGRFSTLEQVISFYCEQVKWSPTVDPLMKKVKQGGIRLNEEDKKYLLAFLNTFTDSAFVSNPDFSDPFAVKVK